MGHYIDKDSEIGNRIYDIFINSDAYCPLLEINEQDGILEFRLMDIDGTISLSELDCLADMLETRDIVIQAYDNQYEERRDHQTVLRFICHGVNLSKFVDF